MAYKMLLKDCLSQAILKLKNSGITSANLDARVLLCHTLNCMPSYLYAHDTDELSTEQIESYAKLIKARQEQKPVAYIVGHKEFYGLDLKVNSHTLIPRPDTETLVDLALNLAQKHNYQSILDLGTGSGAIILAIKKYLPKAYCMALDQSEEALSVAIENSKNLKLDINFIQSHWFSKVTQSFDLIVSNPPYIRADDEHLQALRYEPYSALVSQDQGLCDIKTIVKNAYSYLNKGGCLVIEHGFDQGAICLQIFKDFNYKNVQTIKDYQGNDRVTYGFVEDICKQ